jgi:flagellar biosynthetic protein FliP
MIDGRIAWWVSAPVAVIAAMALLLAPSVASAQTITVPSITIGVDEAESPQQVSLALEIVFLLTVLSLAPAILIMVTSFTRTVIVLSFVRNALGTQQVPPTQVIIGLALFLTFFVMAPTWNQIYTNALQPYLASEISQEVAIDRAIKPVRDFMFSQANESDIGLFVSLGAIDRPRNQDDVPTHVLIPAFVLGELKKAFQMGFVIYLPFLVIDIVVASTLMSMGMMMLPPVMISLPFKLLLFVLVDGWHLVVESLVTSFLR